MRYCLSLFLLFLPFSAFSQNEAVLYDGTRLTVEKCLEISAQKEQQGDKKEASRFLNMAASMCWESKNYPQAIRHFEKSLQLNESIGNENGISMINNNLGMIYADAADYEKSLIYFEKTLETRRKTKERLGIIAANVNIAVVLNNLKRHNEAGKYLEDALKLATEMNDTQQIRSCYGMLAETYQKAGNQQLSMQYFAMYRTFHEMEQKTKEGQYKQVAEQARLNQLLAEAEKKNKELELLNKNKQLVEKEKELVQSDKATEELMTQSTKQELAIDVLKKNNLIKELTIKEEEAKLDAERRFRNLVIAGLALMLLLTGLVFYNYLQKQKINKKLIRQNEEINKQRQEIDDKNKNLEQAFSEIKNKNEKITASINYARMIQQATLPSPERIHTLLPESFVFYKPKDIVSGDFYWIGEKDHKIIVTAADSTGHGVPGAFMSMLGTNLLNRITSRTQPEPDLILHELHKGLNTTLNKKETDNKDGMDMALFVIDKNNNKISFAGAKNSLAYIQNGELTVIKGNRETVGGHYEEKERFFTRTDINLNTPTWLYVFTDGFQDQFGGENGEKKFSSRRLHELILQNHQKDMSSQKQVFEETIENWRKNYKQIDDILVIGVKVNPV
jgi:serine phosphatase RsbU (regulator of sigma subunit)